MTNDAERVSDMLRIIAAALNKGPTESANARQGMALRCSQAADIIEAQSKALAEARVTAIEECAQIADAVRQRMELGRKGKALNQIDEHVAGVCDSLAQRIRSLTPTPENPNG